MSLEELFTSNLHHAWTILVEKLMNNVKPKSFPNDNFRFESRAGIAQSVENLPAWFHTVGISTIGLSFEPHKCLLVGLWNRSARLPCWLPRYQQVLHQR